MALALTASARPWKKTITDHLQASGTDASAQQAELPVTSSLRSAEDAAHATIIAYQKSSVAGLWHPCAALSTAHDDLLMRRHAEQEALRLAGALFGAQAAQFGLGLDAFGRDGDAEAWPSSRRRITSGVAVGGEVAHGDLVDLDLVEQAAQIALQAREAGAEIVHGDAQAEQAQRMAMASTVSYSSSTVW